MDRRAFLRLLGLAGLGASVGRRYFFAPRAGWIPGQLISVTMWERLNVTFPKPGIYTADIDYGCQWELTDLSHFAMAAHPIKDVGEIWIDGRNLASDCRLRVQDRDHSLDDVRHAYGNGDFLGRQQLQDRRLDKLDLIGKHLLRRQSSRQRG